MTSKQIHLVIATPERPVLDIANVVSITAKGVDGEFTVLPSHAPYITQVESGILKYKDPDKTHIIAIGPAFFEFSDDSATLLTDQAILPTEADKARAEEARRKAEEALKQKLVGTDFQAVEAQLRRALLELDLIEHSQR